MPKNVTVILLRRMVEHEYSEYQTRETEAEADWVENMEIHKIALFMDHISQQLRERPKDFKFDAGHVLDWAANALHDLDGD